MREQSLVLAAVFSGAPIPLLSFLLCQTWKGRQSLFWKCRGLLWSWECCLKGRAEAQWQFCTRWCWPHWCRKSFRCDFCSDTGQMFYSWLSSLFNHHTDDVLIEVLLIASVSISVCVCFLCLCFWCVIVCVIAEQFICVSDFLLFNVCVNFCVNERWHKRFCLCPLVEGAS